eukprot:m.58112 g.58112  ORF g.58112 m.58112 type:complete len:228 (+) comp13754_c0_seq16:652-1335(+)
MPCAYCSNHKRILPTSTISCWLCATLWTTTRPGCEKPSALNPFRDSLCMHQVRYLQANVENWRAQPYLDVTSFVKAWSLHHSFWYSQPQPRFIYRYEDLVQNPIIVTKALLQACGLWTIYSLDEYALLRIANISQLQSYRRKQLRSQTRQKNAVSHSYLSHSVEDIRWVLDNFRPELARYGYDQLYTTWLDAKSKDWPTEDAERAIDIIMSNTSSVTYALSYRVKLP